MRNACGVNLSYTGTDGASHRIRRASALPKGLGYALIPAAALGRAVGCSQLSDVPLVEPLETEWDVPEV